MLTNSFLIKYSAGNDPQGNISSGIFRNNAFNQRFQTSTTYYGYCPPSYSFITGVDPTILKTTHGVGIGLTKKETLSPTVTISEVLECFTKGTETYGNCLSFSQILATKKEIGPAPFKLFPNPFASELTLQLNPEMQKGNAVVSLTNVLGSEVFRQDALAGKEVKITLPQLPKGIYIAKIQQNGKTYKTKLVKQ